MNRFIHLAVFLAGLAAVAWVGAGYVGVNLLALAVTWLIGAFYLVGALELRRYQQATDGLVRAMSELPHAPPALAPWLEQLHPSLRHAVRLRVEGERVGLPGPALAPYLAGLLVLLGMLGTFVGMVVTLKGTGFALEGASDLAAIRASLAEPVKGLGVAFGTSLAGIATSAMLGLLSALCRRERQQAGQLLDSRAATTLRPFSQAHQREESFRLLQRQAEAMPLLVDRLQAMMASMEQQSQALHERLAASQDRFHDQAGTAYAGLAASVDRTLKDSLTESARLASAAIQPVAEATMAGVAREAAALHHSVAQAVQQQLDGLSQRFATSTTAVAQGWTDALAEQRRSHEAMSADLRGALAGFTDQFAQRSTALVEGVSARLADTADGLTTRWHGALDQHARASQALSADTQQALARTAAGFDQHAANLLQTVEQAHTRLQADVAARDDQRLAAWTDALVQHERASQALASDTQQALAATAADFAQHAAALQQTVDQAHTRLQAEVAARDDQRLAAWTQALTQHERASQALASDTQQALAGTAAGFEQHAAALQRTVEQAHADLRTQVEARDSERLAAWTASLADMAAALRDTWQQAGAQAARQQQDICNTLADTARTITHQAEAQAHDTILEIGRLVEAAAQAPRAAAEVIGELRAKLSDSLAHDNAMLEERTRVMDTLRTLLDAVNHASTEQRSAIDALVGSSAELLERVGTRFAERVEAETGKLDSVAAQLTGSAVEVASLGEAFGLAVQLFSASNDKLSAQLQGIESALGKSIARSDEQLAYYVAQAREVIDLSILSQQQIVEDLQQLARNQAAVGSEA
ncbi:DUF802 domain-containing protein [Pseudorhodoferax sp. Leaf267]|uniref:DUF802 domain-containing protein n=1 Tax=Pseudorhodoferax sp. Leaf267 TaxID=1736316 RepID=UPI0007022CE2|nr:DUF802 domain-containing protein [Pseudorhodoferax sp. Leaf267]KQP18804.1 hypothetical protein ASF43_29195 [Pseudorhodoferax sp. Leaf267]